MSSEFTQGAYFQPSYQDNQKTRSSRKKSYKYTDEEFMVQPSATQRYRPYDHRYNPNDFSFEDRSEKLRTPKRQVPEPFAKEDNFSPIGGKESNKKKDFDHRINKIQNLNDKISNLLKMVPKGSNQPQEKLNRPKQAQYERTEHTPRQAIANPLLAQYTPYRKIEEGKRNRRTEERKKNFSYLEELNNKIENQQVKKQDREQNQKTERQSSPITKYRNQNQEFKFVRQFDKESKLVDKESKVVEPEISESILRVNNQYDKKGPDTRFKYTNPSLLDKYRDQAKVKQKQNIQKKQKQNEPFEKRERTLLKNAQLDLKISQLKNRIIDDSPLKSKSFNDVFQRQYRIKNEANIDSQRGSDQPTLFKLATKLSFLIDLDVIQRRIRQSFDQYKNDKKWEMLRVQLKTRHIYLDQKQLKEIIKISIHQKNPFGENTQAFPLNGVKDLAKLYAETDRIWKEDLDKFISLDDLASEKFEMAFLDINRKGYLSIEDLVCFVNVHAEKFYRSRDLAQLFRRFLGIEGKSLQKNISDGIQYRTFMGKICK